ncbi:MAG: ATP-dependent zinc metalloprotease FtsH [Candidatus Hydrogenedentes bacterium]|nr:ATP-dependent zinc metalloprotease FtsH [Candidatus Hydrogenedentota bacterium]
MNGFLKQVSLWIVLLIIVVLALSAFTDWQKPRKEYTEADFVAQVLDEKDTRIESVSVTEEGEKLFSVEVRFAEEMDGRRTASFTTNEFKDDWKQQLSKKGVPVKFAPQNTLWTSLLFNVVPLLLIIGLFWFFMFRQMQGGSAKAMSFGKSRARMVNQSDKTVTFADVAGVDEAKEELQEVVEFLKDPKKFTRLGGKIPRGVILVGPPGSGKTLLARAVAGEASVPFFSISGSDFVEMFVGVGASRVRDLFQQGHKHAPCIIFIDEIDAVGRQRGAGLGGGHDEREQTLNQLLVEMDGFNTNDGVILMAATNRPDVLDAALLRPGRFDRQIVVSNPDIKGRKQILEIHIRNQKVPIDDEVDTQVLARATPGFSGADLANLVNEAALLAARRGQDSVTMHDFEEAKDRVLMGPARRSLVMTPKEKLATAYHEAGHTLVGRLLPDTDPVHKVTIIPRGQALGVTSALPEEDRHSVAKPYCLATLRYAMGGRAAEEMVYGQFNSGAASDLKRSTQLAHAMVCEWGMSELGPVSFAGQSEVFLGRDFARMREFSEETAAAIDREVHRLLEEAYKDAKDIVTQHRNILDALAEALFERETLEAEEIDAIIRAHGGADLLPEKPKKEESFPAPAKPRRHKESGEAPEEVKAIPPGDIVPDTA